LLKFQGKTVARLSKVTRVQLPKRIFSLTELSDGTFNLTYSTEHMGDWTEFLSHFQMSPESDEDKEKADGKT
jgi:hypothetical protein